MSGQIIEGFRGKTLLCIAHRLKTSKCGLQAVAEGKGDDWKAATNACVLVIHYDRICVMDAGQIAELDSPLKLYDQGGIFRSMCERSGIKREEIAGA